MDGWMGGWVILQLTNIPNPNPNAKESTLGRDFTSSIQSWYKSRQYAEFETENKYR